MEPTATRSDGSTHSAVSSVAAAHVTEAVSRHAGVEGEGEERERGAIGGKEGGSEPSKTEWDGATLEEGVAMMSVVASEGEGVSRYYSKPPDWALSLCVT